MPLRMAGDVVAVVTGAHARADRHRRRCCGRQESLRQAAGTAAPAGKPPSGWQETLLLWSQETQLWVAGCFGWPSRRCCGGRPGRDVVSGEPVVARHPVSRLPEWTCQFVAVEQCRGRHGHAPRHGEVPGIR